MCGCGGSGAGCGRGGGGGRGRIGGGHGGGRIGRGGGVDADQGEDLFAEVFYALVADAGDGGEGGEGGGPLAGDVGELVVGEEDVGGLVLIFCAVVAPGAEAVVERLIGGRDLDGGGGRVREVDGRADAGGGAQRHDQREGRDSVHCEHMIRYRERLVVFEEGLDRGVVEAAGLTVERQAEHPYLHCVALLAEDQTVSWVLIGTLDGLSDRGRGGNGELEKNIAPISPGHFAGSQRFTSSTTHFFAAHPSVEAWWLPALTAMQPIPGDTHSH